MNFRSFFLVMITVGSIQAMAMDGSSGCGPGWYLFKEDSLVSSAFRATTNGVLFPISTLGMTFGTSNCTRHKLALKEKESLQFATQNHFELKTELAKGQGEYLNAYASTLGCPSSMQQHLNRKLRSQFKVIYPDSAIDPQHTLIETYKAIFSDPELTQKCSLSAV